MTKEKKSGKCSRRSYNKPVLISHGNLKAMTFECPDWQCSVTVPGPPA